MYPSHTLFAFLPCPASQSDTPSSFCPPRHPVQPQLHSAVWGPGRGDEGHPGGEEHEGADPEGAAPPPAAAAAAGTPQSGGQAVSSEQHEPQQRQQG